ncbi:group 1 truncated hemoglobin [Gammaproteobacteria bacterium 53_120_T64]|nr:group 1 truncated hemoglobin [Gammaproteobacteria bacterium 53_120_T64]
MDQQSLYERLGGYDGISSFACILLVRLQSDSQLGRFWAHRGDDGIAREKQLLIDYLCSVTGGPVYYRGRDMKLSHQGMGISDSDWAIFLEHAGAAMKSLGLAKQECDEIVAFVLSLKKDIVDA